MAVQGPVTAKLVRVALDGSTAFYGAILQELAVAGHPFLVLRSGHLVVAEASLLHLRAVKDTWTGVIFGGGAVHLCREPEPVTLHHSRAGLPSKHIASGNAALGQFILQVYGKLLVTGRGKWVFLDKNPDTPESMERDLDQKGTHCESARDGINQAIDTLMGSLP